MVSCPLIRKAVVVVNACRGWWNQSRTSMEPGGPGSSCLRPFCRSQRAVGRRPGGQPVWASAGGFLACSGPSQAQVLFASWSSRGSAGVVGRRTCASRNASWWRSRRAGWPARQLARYSARRLGAVPAGGVAGWLVSVAFPWPWRAPAILGARRWGPGGPEGLWGWGRLAGSQVQPFGWVGPGPSSAAVASPRRQAVVLVNRPELQALQF